jgi:hypothetical protein
VTRRYAGPAHAHVDATILPPARRTFPTFPRTGPLGEVNTPSSLAGEGGEGEGRCVQAMGMRPPLVSAQAGRGINLPLSALSGGGMNIFHLTSLT